MLSDPVPPAPARSAPRGKSRAGARRIAVSLLATVATALGGAASATAATAPAAPRVAQASHQRSPFDYYLALGDSLAAGSQPNSSGELVTTKQGYASDIAAGLRAQDHDLKFTNLSCPGETTGTMLNGGCPSPISYAPFADQTAAAVAFLKKHHGARVLVTIDIGANNVDGCVTATGIDPTCVAAGIESAGTDLTAILTKLKAAAGPHTVFAGMNYYDPFLAAWLAGPAGQAEATASVSLSNTFNTVLGDVYGAFGVPVADVATQFDTADFTPVVPLGNGVSVPLNVARICEWTWMCAPAPVGPNIHANAVGYLQLAAAFDRVIPVARQH
jgi:lysophospholipase L1-like esterase